MSMHSDFATALRDPAAPAPPGLSSWNGSDPEQRFAVYRNNVAVSLVDALANTFPVVQELVGTAFFRAMAHQHTLSTPPRHPVLADYGAGFADFIASYPPAAALPYLADVARLEYLRLDALHAADALPLDPAALTPYLTDPERLPGLRLQPHPALRRFQARHAAVSLWAAHQEDDASTLADIDWQQPESALITRPALAVIVLPLRAAEYTLLTALADGQSLATALDAAADIDPEVDLASVLERALRHGLFCRINDNA